MAKVLIVYYYCCGNTAKMSEAFAVGAPDERAKNSCRRMGERVARLTVKLFG